MKKLTFITCLAVLFIGGCQLLSSDGVSSPVVTVEPAPAVAGEEILITISGSNEFIVSHCGGLFYEIEKLEDDDWSVFKRNSGACSGFRSEMPVPKSIYVNLTIEEEGIYRFLSLYKFNSDDYFETIYSDEFEVVSK